MLGVLKGIIGLMHCFYIDIRSVGTYCIRRRKMPKIYYAKGGTVPVPIPARLLRTEVKESDPEGGSQHIGYLVPTELCTKNSDFCVL